MALPNLAQAQGAKHRGREECFALKDIMYGLHDGLHE